VTAVELDERTLCRALRRGDEQAFAALVREYHVPLRRLALSIVRMPAAADDVVQETWLAVIRHIDRFEERSSLKTWIYRILVNAAKTRAVRDRRTVPLSSLELDDGPSVDPDRFRDAEDRWPGHWIDPPARWQDLPEDLLEERQTMKALTDAIAELPPVQRSVIVLRDIEGWSPEEVCELLEVSDANQRVLLHRARSKVRASVEQALGEAG
jgi:RNA polymerase sigma-70 factor (ECF subfamily)